jgi:hypothetical protein
MADDPRISAYERFVNTVAADTEVLKLVLRLFLANMAKARGTQIIDELQEMVGIALRQREPDPSDGQMVKRLHEVTRSQADEYFRLLRAVVGLSGTCRGPAN